VNDVITKKINEKSFKALLPLLEYFTALHDKIYRFKDTDIGQWVTANSDDIGVISSGNSAQLITDPQ
jgi:hypothetical protein